MPDTAKIKPAVSLQDFSEPLTHPDALSAARARVQSVSQTSDHVSLFLQVRLLRLAFCESHFGQLYRQSPEEAGGMGQSPLLGKAPRGSEQGLLSAKTEQRAGSEWQSQLRKGVRGASVAETWREGQV